MTGVPENLVAVRWFLGDNLRGYLLRGGAVPNPKSDKDERKRKRKYG